MSRQGIRAFFNKKENTDPQNREILKTKQDPASQTSTTATSATRSATILKSSKRRLEDDDTTDEEIAPVVKQTKKRRVLLDSDDEQQLDTSVNTLVEEEQRSNDVAESVTNEKPASLMDATLHSPTAKDKTVSGVQTPPKRTTARKRTAPRLQSKVKTSSKSSVNEEEGMESMTISNKSPSGNLDECEINGNTENIEMETDCKLDTASPSRKFDTGDKSLSKKSEQKEKGSSKQGGKVTPADQTTVGYNPAKTKYHPIEDACWKRGQKVPYMAIAKTFEYIEEESGRLKIIGILTNFLRSVVALSPQEIVKCVNLCLNKLGPAYEGIELGIGESVLVKAISDATGRSPQHIKSEVAEKGDLGIVAMGSRSTQRTMFTPSPLTVSGVFSKLKDIASLTGNSSQAKKVLIIKGLFVACKNSEAKYLMRSLGGKLRIGLAEQSVLVSLSHAVVYTPPSQEWPLEIVDASVGISSEQFKKRLDMASEIVKTAYCELPNYDVMIPALLQHGVEELPNHCSLTPGIPLKPMLAHPTKGIEEVLKRFDGLQFTCEWKYDGERAQIHVLSDGQISVFSRNQENNTSKYPDIISRIPNVLSDNVKSCVIDAEAVAWDKELKQILPFQVLSTRKRKDANVADIKVQVCVFAFDLLYLNGRSLVREPFQKRRELLRQSINETEGEVMFVKSTDSSNLEDIQTFMEDSIKGNCEGLMVKTLEKEASYEIAKRSHNWLKLKKDYLDGVGDTLDLVVIGGFHGSGKRTGRYGGFLLACYNEDSEEYEVICKIGTGFTDDSLQLHTNFLKDHIIDKPKAYYQFNEGVSPDHWFDAVQVWEVKAADLSISPVYTAAAGIVDPEKGISLRFPRFIRIRDDKGPEQATTSVQVAELYRKQENNTTKKSPEPEDY